MVVGGKRQRWRQPRHCCLAHRFLASRNRNGHAGAPVDLGRISTMGTLMRSSVSRYIVSSGNSGPVLSPITKPRSPSCGGLSITVVGGLATSAQVRYPAITFSGRWSHSKQIKGTAARCNSPVATRARRSESVGPRCRFPSSGFRYQAQRQGKDCWKGSSVGRGDAPHPMREPSAACRHLPAEDADRRGCLFALQRRAYRRLGDRVDRHAPHHLPVSKLNNQSQLRGASASASIR